MTRLALINKLYKMKDGEVKRLYIGNSSAFIEITKGDWHLDDGINTSTNKGYEGEFWIETSGGEGPDCWLTNAINASDCFDDEQLKNINW